MGGQRGPRPPPEIFLAPLLPPPFFQKVQNFEFRIYCLLKILANENNHLLSDNQFGFRRNRSTEQAIAFFTDQIRTKMYKGQLTGAVFIDMSKAFDTISHASIINKLPSYGISGTEHQWLTSYLFGRKQHVSFLGTTSTSI